MMVSLLKKYFASAAVAALVTGAVAVSLTSGTAAAAPTTVADATTSAGDCGSIDMSTADAAKIAAAATCFHQAFSSCQPAMLRATWEANNETIERLISVSPGDYSCMVVESVTRTPSGSGTDSSDTFRCAGVSTSGGGLIIQRCGNDGDVRILAAN